MEFLQHLQISNDNFIYYLIHLYMCVTGSLEISKLNSYVLIFTTSPQSFLFLINIPINSNLQEQSVQILFSANYVNTKFEKSAYWWDTSHEELGNLQFDYCRLSHHVIADRQLLLKHLLNSLTVIMLASAPLKREMNKL